jgi:uncharacterized protein with GYD domain
MTTYVLLANWTDQGIHLQLGMLGNVRTRTLKAFPEAAYREIINSLG